MTKREGHEKSMSSVTPPCHCRHHRKEMMHNAPDGDVPSLQSSTKIGLGCRSQRLTGRVCQCEGSKFAYFQGRTAEGEARKKKQNATSDYPSPTAVWVESVAASPRLTFKVRGVYPWLGVPLSPTRQGLLARHSLFLDTTLILPALVNTQ